MMGFQLFRAARIPQIPTESWSWSNGQGVWDPKYRCHFANVCIIVSILVYHRVEVRPVEHDLRPFVHVKTLLSLPIIRLQSYRIVSKVGLGWVGLEGPVIPSKEVRLEPFGIYLLYLNQTETPPLGSSKTVFWSILSTNPTNSSFIDKPAIPPRPSRGRPVSLPR